MDGPSGTKCLEIGQLRSLSNFVYCNGVRVTDGARMRDDDIDERAEELSDKDIEVIQGGGVRFGDYTVLSPGVQIILGGRAVSRPGD